METITKNIPALALRGLTVFPRMTASFDVEREISVRALERAMETGQEIFLVTQRELGVELPEEKDLYEVGTVARVIQILRASNSMMRVVMEGGSRARLRRLWQREPFLQAQVELIGEEKSPRHGTRTEAMLRQTYALFGEYSELLPKQPESIFTTVMDATDPGFLADFIAQNSNLRYQDKQSVLEELRPLMRLRRVNEILKREISVIAMEQDIESKVRERVGQIQKDMILREQVKVLQNELGEGDSDAEFDEYRTRICACRLPDGTADDLAWDLGEREYDGVLSFETLHHLLPEEKEKLYVKMFRALRPGGCYVECDYMACCQEEQDLCWNHYQYRRAKYGGRPGRLVHIDIPLTLDRQVELLDRAGFVNIQVLHQRECTVILKAYRPGSACFI